MKKIVKTKYFIIWLIVWISLLSIWTYASVTWAGTLWSLFEKVWTVYRFVWDNIKDNTVDSSEIEDNTLTADDLADNSVWSWELANNAVDTNAIQDKVVTSIKIADWVIPNKVSDLTNDKWYLTGFVESDPLSLKIDWNTIKKSWYLKIWNSTSFYDRSRNMIRIWDGNYIRIWEWEEDDKLSIYARKWVSINWIKLEKKVKENWSWHKVIDNTISWDWNYSEETKTYTVPSWKWVYRIKLSWNTDDGWACVIYAPRKLALAITHKAYISKLELSWDRSWNAKNKWSWNMRTQEFYLKWLAGNKYLWTQNHGDNYAYNVSWDGEDISKGFLDSWTTLYMSQWYNWGPGWEKNHCVMYVKLWDFYY